MKEVLKKNSMHITAAVTLLLVIFCTPAYTGPEENEPDMVDTGRTLFFEEKTFQEMREEKEREKENREKKEADKKNSTVNWQNRGKGDNRNNDPWPFEIHNPLGEKNKDPKAEKLPEETGYGITPGLNLGFTFPGFAYGRRYKNTPGYSAGTRLERYSRFGLVPEAVFRYSDLESRDREGKVDSEMSLSQFSVGARYNINVKLPVFLSRYSFFKSPVTLYLRASEGITRVSFSSDRVTTPIVEYINTIELSTGFTYPVYQYIETGLDFGYRHIATKDVPLQAFYLMVMVGVRV